MGPAPADSAVLEQHLRATSTVAERVATLVVVLDTSIVAKAASVSVTAVRKWSEGTEPRSEAAMAIDDLRAVTVVLLEGGFESERIRSWLVSRDYDWLDGARPLEELSKSPGLVMSAAHDAVIVHRFGPGAAAGAEDRGSESAAPQSESRDARSSRRRNRRRSKKLSA